MMKTKFFITLMSSGLFITSCSTKPITQTTEENSETTNEISDHHNAQNALDWAGTYSGVEPCADCQGIKTTLKLNKDKTYELTTNYLKNNEDTTTKKSGAFNWKDGNTIKLNGFSAEEGSPLFKVEENRLRHLKLDGNQVQGELAQHYVLTKNGNPEAEDKKWQLVELNGKTIDSNPENYYLILNSKEGRLNAKANCNILNLPYTIENQFRIRVGEGISTLMACEDNTEAELLEVLRRADNISVGENTLSLNRARMAPLARFVLVQ